MQLHLVPATDPDFMPITCEECKTKALHAVWTFYRSGTCGHEGHRRMHLIIRCCDECGAFTEWMMLGEAKVQIVLDVNEVNSFLDSITAEIKKGNKPDLPF